MTNRFFVTAVALVAVAASAPAIADSVVNFARNAGRVDNFDAVAAGDDDRAGKLVATNRKGELPSGAIGTAPNARRLGNHVPADYAQTCLPGVVVGSALVPADVAGSYSEVDAWQYVKAPYEGNVRCTLQEFLEARRTGPGVYQVAFVTGRMCNAGAPERLYQTVVTVKSADPLSATAQTTCDQNGRPVEEVRIVDATGVPRDATFTIALLSHTASLP